MVWKINMHIWECHHPVRKGMPQDTLKHMGNNSILLNKMFPQWVDFTHKMFKWVYQ